MNTRRFFLAFLATYVVYQATGFLIHGLWLDPVYVSLADVFRPREQMDTMMWMMSVSSAVMVGAFCYIFTRGYENRGIGEGVRFGVIMGLFFIVVQAFDAYVVYPLPMSLAVKWFAAGMAQFIVMGIVVSLIYKSEI